MICMGQKSNFTISQVEIRGNKIKKLLMKLCLWLGKKE